MENIKRGLIFVAVILAAYLIYSEVTSLPNRIVKEAKSVSQLLDRYQNTVAVEQKYLEQVKQSGEWKVLAGYSKQEGWEQTIVKAGKQIGQLQKYYEDEVEKILDNNHKDDIPKLRESLIRIKQEADNAINIAKQPRNMVAFINNSIKNKEQLYSTATKKLDSSKIQAEDFRTKVRAATKSHPRQFKAISKKNSEINALLKKQQNHVDRLVREYNSSNTNFIEYGNAFEQAKKLQLELSKELKIISEQLEDLDRNFVKILTDQKVDYFITIGRANWCEGEYCNEGSQMRYPAVKVDDDTMNYFNQSNISPIAKFSGSWGSPSFSLNIPENRWNALGIDKYYRWNRSEPYAEYWIDNTQEKTFHRYTTIEDGKVNEGSWQEIPNQYFWEHYENLGMALVTKPIGYFESEAIQTPEPVGLATVAKPEMVDGVAKGSNQYGEWRRDSSGNSFWFYYSMYRILGDFGPGRYGYNDWYGYSARDRSRPYYGTTGQYGTFGKNTYQNSRYRNSAFSKRNPNASKSAMTGKRSSSVGSLRGAGASNRGKGPSRSGK